MISPFTGGSVTVKHKIETLSFRKETYQVNRHYYECDDTGRTFSDARQDEMFFDELYRQYRERHGIPSPADLMRLRKKYDLSARVMSKIAGIGINQYGLYENGEMPTPAIGQLLTSLFDRDVLLEKIDKVSQKLGTDYQKVRNKVALYVEPVKIPLKKVYYKDFVEQVQLSVLSDHRRLQKKARWTTCNVGCTW